MHNTQLQIHHGSRTPETIPTKMSVTAYKWCTIVYILVNFKQKIQQ